MRKLPFNRLCWLALRASTALALTVAPYHLTLDGGAKIVPTMAHAEGDGGGHDGGGDGRDGGGHDGGDGHDGSGGDSHDGADDGDSSDDSTSGSDGGDASDENAGDDNSTPPPVTSN